MRARPIDTLPDNLPEFIEEVAAGLTGLYGPAAGAAYRRAAPKAIETAMRSPQVHTYCAQASGEVAGLVMAHFQDGAGRVPFIHVLARYCGRKIEHRLVKEAVAPLRTCGVDHIVSECIAFCDIDLRKSFTPLDFRVFSRQLMMAEAQMVSHLGTAASRSVSCTALDMHSAGETIAAAYADHTERDLHPDVQDPAAAERYIQATLRGAYGLCCPEYVRVIREHGRVAAVILGCEVAPGVGFVLQVAVRPDAQNRGLGEALVQDLASCFVKQGIEKVALGVTISNKARDLYVRLGFEPLRDVEAFVWQRPSVGVAASSLRKKVSRVAARSARRE